MKKEVIEYLEGMIKDREEMIVSSEERLKSRIENVARHSGEAKEYFEAGEKAERELLNVLYKQKNEWIELLEENDKN